MAALETTRMAGEHPNKGGQKGGSPCTPVTVRISNILPEEKELDSTSGHIALFSTFMGCLLSLRQIDNNNNPGDPFMLSCIFKCRIFAFQAYVISIMFAFSTSFSALMFFHGSRVKEARFFRSCSVLCFFSAVALLLYAICSPPAQMCA